MMQCAVPRCKKTARHPANLCASHWERLDEQVKTEMEALAGDASVNMANRQKYQIAAGRLVMLLAQGESPMKADP